jgi:hypothetical protein
VSDGVETYPFAFCFSARFDRVVLTMTVVFALIYRSLPLGQQLCGNWQPQILSPFHLLHITFLHVLVHIGHGEILFLHESTGPYSSTSFDMLGQAKSTLINTGIGGRVHSLWLVYGLHDH